MVDNPVAETQDQTFPVLSAAQIESAKRFASGPEQAFAPSQEVYGFGALNSPSWLVTEGSIDVYVRDGLSAERHYVTFEPGQFTGEVSQLAGRASIAAGRGGRDGCKAIPFDAAHLRALMIGSADLGAIYMRALIRRRVNLIHDGGVGTILIGNPNSADTIRLQGYLTRSAYPNRVLDQALDNDGRQLVERLGLTESDLPLVVCPNGTLLRNPNEVELSASLGETPAIDPDHVYDVAVVGAGPAGLAASVYGASEGLSVIVLDGHEAGGQAGASSRIENYLGFPAGVSGQELTGRAYSQALKFGAEIAIPLQVDRLNCDGPLPILWLKDGRAIKTRTIVVASGARYRRPNISNLADFEGTGVSYWVSPIEARLCAGEEVALVGGGNSAGQAVVFLAPQVRKLNLVVRRDLSFTMSKYLIDRIAALPNVEVHVGAEIAGLEGDRTTGLTAAVFRHNADGAIKRCALTHLFVFIGADPNTDWLKGCVDMDEHGFVITGQGANALATSEPAVFAIGDVRAGSTKRVAAAVGEGAAVIAQIHGVLAQQQAGEKQ